MGHPADDVRLVLKSQYHAALAMLRQAISLCDDEIWNRRDDRNACWQIAYHTLYFTHFYLQPTADAFVPWAEHQANVQHEDGQTGPADPQSALPLIPEPYSREQILRYCDYCDAIVDSAIDAFDPLSSESGFSWYPVSKLEHQIVNLRHIQIGAAHLGERVRATRDLGVRWVGSGHEK